MKLEQILTGKELMRWEGLSWAVFLSLPGEAEFSDAFEKGHQPRGERKP